MRYDKNGLWELYKLYGSQDRMAMGGFGISKAFKQVRPGYGPPGSRGIMAKGKWEAPTTKVYLVLQELLKFNQFIMVF